MTRQSVCYEKRPVDLLPSRCFDLSKWEKHGEGEALIIDAGYGFSSDDKITEHFLFLKNSLYNL